MVSLDLEHAALAILRMRPHAVIICEPPSETFRKEASEMVLGLPDQRLVLHEPGESIEILDQQLREIRREVDMHQQRMPASQRIVFFDPVYSENLNGSQSAAKPNHETLLGEQDKLLTLVEAAVEHLDAALRYREQLGQWTPHENSEVAYRLMNDTCLSVPSAQEQTGRWLAVMAHFIPGVDTCSLPTPGDAIEGVKWVFDGSSLETSYAAASVAQLGFSAVLCEQVQALLSQKCTPRDNPLTAQMALALTGCCSLLHEVATAHLLVMARALNPAIESRTQSLREKSTLKEHQLFCEFWELKLFRDYPALLIKTIDDFHRGRRSATKVTAPRFLKFYAQS
jgi:hypothetical protein